MTLKQTMFIFKANVESGGMEVEGRFFLKVFNIFYCVKVLVFKNLKVQPMFEL